MGHTSYSARDGSDFEESVTLGTSFWRTGTTSTGSLSRGVGLECGLSLMADRLRKQAKAIGNETREMAASFRHPCSREATDRDRLHRIAGRSSERHDSLGHHQ